MYASNATYMWQDVSVANNLPWINAELATLPAPEPAAGAIVLGAAAAMALRRRTHKDK